MKLLTPKLEAEIKEALGLYWAFNPRRDIKPIECLSQNDALKVQRTIRKLDDLEVFPRVPTKEERCPSCNCDKVLMGCFCLTEDGEHF